MVKPRKKSTDVILPLTPPANPPEEFWVLVVFALTAVSILSGLGGSYALWQNWGFPD
jgi:hypothetical protein